MDSAWRRLGLFWAGVLAVTVTGAAALQVMGPPAAPAPATLAAVTAPVPSILASNASASNALASNAPASPIALNVPAMPSPAMLGVVRPPDAALSEPAPPEFPGRSLPRRAADGRMSMTYYARAVDEADTRPRVAVLMAGLGQSDADSRAASASLPGAVSLGFSPYATNPDPLLADARSHGHEYLVTLPMESTGYPLNESGPHALLTGNEPAANARNLLWVLSRMQGEVGLTGASDGLRGERFAQAEALLNPVLEQLARRGLLYVDPRPGAPARPGMAAATLVIDDPPDRVSMDTKLEQLEQRAHDGELVLGLAGRPRPVTIERIAAWAHGLDSRGVALVPASALVHPPLVNAP